MLHTDEHAIIPFTRKSLLTFASVLMLITAPLWWSKVQMLAGSSAKIDLRGEWVGDATITSSIVGIGSSQSMHRPAALYLNLSSYSSSLDKVQGQGQLFLAGEQQPRAVHVVTLGPVNPDGHLSGEISGDLYAVETPDALKRKDSGRILQGKAGDDVLVIHTVDDGTTIGYVFESTLHHGSRLEFQTLCHRIGK